MYKINPIKWHSITGHITNDNNEDFTEQENMLPQHSARWYWKVPQTVCLLPRV